MIRGEKVDLVAVSMDYLDYYLRWLNDPVVTDMLGDTKLPYSREKEREWVEAQIAAKDDHRTFTVLTKKGQPIGNVGFNVINYQSRRAIVGIVMGEKRLWDKGYGTDAMRTLMKFGFEELGMDKLELGVHSLNKRAIVCYEKCGFKLEGVQRNSDYYNGKYIDGLTMGILKEEWLRSTKKGATRKKCD
jgi:RimJ/RimL family protein N-acetyltransferase